MHRRARASMPHTTTSDPGGVMRPVTPRGFRDVLPAEAAERESVTAAVSAVFSAWGYERVETPVVEVYDTLRAAAGELEGTAFRLFDVDGRLLALRPDMTVPIARLVASRMAEQPGPHRFRYSAEVFREHESLRGQARQFTQLGIELVGAAGPVADAEAIAVLVEALDACGLADFTVALGDVAVLSAIVGVAGGDEPWSAAVFSAAHERNLVSLDRLSRQDGIAEEAGRALREVVRTRGGAEAVAACRALIAGLGSAEVLDELAETWRLLEAAGVAERVVVDFGVMRGFDYYTGLVFDAYAPGLGLPVAGGGRYDAVLARYGASSPAAGFAIGLERLTIALAEQAGGAGLLGGVDAGALVGGDAERAFAEAARLRASGERATLAAGLTGEALAAEAAARGMRAVEAR